MLTPMAMALSRESLGHTVTHAHTHTHMHTRTRTCSLSRALARTLSRNSHVSVSSVALALCLTHSETHTHTHTHTLSYARLCLSLATSSVCLVSCFGPVLRALRTRPNQLRLVATTYPNHPPTHYPPTQKLPFARAHTRSHSQP